MLTVAEVVELLGEVGGTAYRGKQSVFAMLLRDDAVGRTVGQVLDDVLLDDDALSNRDAVITTANQVAVWREVVRHVLVDRRRVVLRALRAGFSGWSAQEAMRQVPPRRSAFCASPGASSMSAKQWQTAWNFPPVHPAVQLLRNLSFRERQRVVCGEEEITPATIVKQLAPSTKSTANRQHQNFRLLVAVLESEAYRPHLKSFLKFVTSSGAVLDGVTKITVNFDKKLDNTHLPKAHTCFASLVLPHEAYPSQEDLLRKLVICAENATGFGTR